MWMNWIVLSLLATAGGEEVPGSDWRDYVLQSSAALETCEWSVARSEEALAKGLRRRAELVVVHYGKITIHQRFDGKVTAQAVVVDGDPYELMAKQLIRHGDEGACQAIPTMTHHVPADEANVLRDLMAELDSLPAFDFDDVIILHQPIVQVAIVGWNLRFSAEWFYGDASAMANWAERVLDVTAPRLKVKCIELISALEHTLNRPED